MIRLAGSVNSSPFQTHLQCACSTQYLIISSIVPVVSVVLRKYSFPLFTAATNNQSTRILGLTTIFTDIQLTGDPLILRRLSSSSSKLLNRMARGEAQYERETTYPLPVTKGYLIRFSPVLCFHAVLVPSPFTSYLQNPYYFMHASLVEKDSDDDVLLIKDTTRSKDDTHLFKDNRTKATTGSSVSSLYPLKDFEDNGQESGFFVFPDLSVRMEGTYRLKFCLYEMVG